MVPAAKLPLRLAVAPWALHVTVAVNWLLSVATTDPTGVAPLTGAVTPFMALSVITVSPVPPAAAVAGNTAVTTTLAAVPAVLVTVVASATSKPKLAATPSVV